jgi:deoxyribose-phosphate aldolase
VNSSVAARVIGLIDLTNLSDDCSENDVVELCSRAHGPHGNVAAVCVWPRYVSRAVRELTATDVRVATVVNFPHGRDSVDQVVDSVKRCVADGADEIDLVIPYEKFRDSSDDEGDRAVVHMVAKVKESLPENRLLKVILETGELRDRDLVDRAARLAVASGADFIKTSTGKASAAATLPLQLCMLEAIRDVHDATGRIIGMKPAGGIRTAKQAVQYLVQVHETLGTRWLTPDLYRLGASSLLNDVLMQLRTQRTGRYQSLDYFSND